MDNGLLFSVAGRKPRLQSAPFGARYLLGTVCSSSLGTMKSYRYGMWWIRSEILSRTVSGRWKPGTTMKQLSSDAHVGWTWSNSVKKHQPMRGRRIVRKHVCFVILFLRSVSKTYFRPLSSQYHSVVLGNMLLLEARHHEVQHRQKLFRFVCRSLT